METPAAAHVSSMRSELLELGNRQHRIEAEIAGIASELQDPAMGGGQPVGLKGNLLDADGFPRADIDIYAVREGPPPCGTDPRRAPS